MWWLLWGRDIRGLNGNGKNTIKNDTAKKEKKKKKENRSCLLMEIYMFMAIITWNPKLYTATKFIFTFLSIYYLLLLFKKHLSQEDKLTKILLFVSGTFWKSIYLINSTTPHQDHSPFAEQ